MKEEVEKFLDSVRDDDGIVDIEKMIRELMNSETDQDFRFNVIKKWYWDFGDFQRDDFFEIISIIFDELEMNFIKIRRK